MNDLLAFDWLVIVTLLGATFAACGRGLGKETLHTLLYLGTLVAGYLYLSAQTAPIDAAATATMLVNLGYYVGTVYILTWVVMRVGAPLILDGGPLGTRSRFWAGMLCLIKLIATILGLNLWLAVHSPDAHPLRLNQLPPFLRDSTIVQLSDAVTEDIYQWTASKGWLDYHKFTKRSLTPEEEATRQNMETLGITPMKENTP